MRRCRCGRIKTLMMELLFVYNAKGGLFNALSDTAHKLLSPSTYPCSLCALTYGPLSMRKAWAEYLRGLELPLRFLHLEEWTAAYPVRSDALPAVFLRQQGGGLRSFITAAELNALPDLDALIALVQDRVGQGPGRG